MFPENIKMPSTKTMISTAASIAASAMLLRSLARDFVPRELQHYFFTKLRNFLGSFSTEVTLIFEEFDGLGHNELFKAAGVYLGNRVSPSTHRFRVTMPQKENKISISMERNDAIIDNFNGVSLKWRFVSRQIQSKYVTDQSGYNSTLHTELRYFELSFHKKHKEVVFNRYLEHVIEESKAVKDEKKTLKLFTLRYDRMRPRRGDAWQSVNLDHPATFDTLAMDSDIKKMVMDDLERFVKRKQFYRKVGKAWKRGYLLFGPPGTGKSSLIAAMANYLNFDIYDLELTDLRCNSELRRLLISTANRSILVVEDIDCSIDLQNRLKEARVASPYPGHNQGTQVTLSGLLNFIDGLWSSCGDERIIVFTTNHKDRLDPALLRPGRMDVHIRMSYCTPCGFKTLAANYLGITEHPLILVVEQLIEMTKVTPAEVGEQLMKNEEPKIALEGLIGFLKQKEEQDETKDGEIKPDAAASAAAGEESIQEQGGEKIVSAKPANA